MNGPDINSPFAQALIREGQARGYSPFDIAGSIGNAFTENGLRTDGMPGDNGTAFGGMQWRNERHAALKAEAQKHGKDWTDPLVQASHWYNEQDATGNKGAEDITSANDMAINSLRPAGYKQGQTNDGVMHYAQRLSASQQALAAMNGAQAPVDPDAPSAGTQNASSVPSGAPGSFQIPGSEGGVMNQSQQPQYEPTMGDKLSQLSAAFFRRDSPNTAASMENALQAKINGERANLKAQQASERWSTGAAYQNAQGKWMQQQTAADGRIRNTAVAPEAIPAPDPDKPAGRPEVQAAKDQSIAVQNLEQLEPVRNAVNTLREALQKGTFEVGPDKTGKMVINNLTGNSTANDLYLKSMQSNIINAASIVAQSQKGSMTNFKFAKDMEMVMPSFANNDKKAAYEALTRVSEGITGAYNGNVSAVNKYAGMFPKTLGTTFDGEKGESVSIGEYFGNKAKVHAAREKAMHDATPDFLAQPGRGASKGPEIGLVKNGYKFLGGDPSNQASWQKAD